MNDDKRDKIFWCVVDWYIAISLPLILLGAVTGTMWIWFLMTLALVLYALLLMIYDEKESE